ncbi:Speckle-type POZ protein B [Formica fusca]
MNSATDITTDNIYHCQTQLELSEFSYTWSIANFWKTLKFVSGLQGGAMQNYFKLCVLFQEDKLQFYALNENDVKYGKQKIRISYSVFSNITETKLMSIRASDLFFDKNKELLYELSISDLKSNSEKYLSKGVFTICFKFYKFDNLFNSDIHYSFKYSNQYSYEQKRSVIDMQSSLPNKKLDSLVTFVINKKHLQASKALLCSKSKVFEAMFNCGLNESVNNKVEITDIKYDILQQLLFFLQTGYLSEDARKDAKVAYELFIAAEKYDIKDLKLICEQDLIRNTTKKNVVKHLKFAHINNGTTLKNYALDFIKLYLKDIVDTSDFISLMQDYHELLIQIENIRLPVTNTKYSIVRKSAFF